MRVTKRGTDLDWMEKDLDYIKKQKQSLASKMAVIEDMEKRTASQVNQIRQKDQHYARCESQQREIVERQTELKRARMEREQAQQQLQQAVQEK